MSNRGRRGGGSRGGSKGHWGGGGNRYGGSGGHKPGVNPQPNVHSDNPVIQQFQKFAVSLDQRHDKRERLVKLSRDVTIEAKRIIFLLHRISLEDVDDFRETEANSAVLDEAETRLRDVQLTLWKMIGTELEGEDPWFYLRAYTAGLQEYVEALSFYHHLKFGELISWEEVGQATKNSTKDIKVETDTESPTYSVPVDPTKDSKEEEILGEVLVPRADYMLGVADLTGEVMRQAVNSAGAGNARMCFQLLQFLQEIHDGFVALPNGHREISRKLLTLQSSLRKVENVCYNINVRGTEVPKHMLGAYMEIGGSGSKPPPDYQEGDMEEGY